MPELRLDRRQLFASLLAGAAAAVGCEPGQNQPTSRKQPAGQPEVGTSGLFRNVAARAGIHFVQGHGTITRLNILDTIGSGCAFLDYDGDGWLDILLVGQPSCALYRNRRDGTFEDVTKQAGLSAPGHWLGCAVGDFDNDGLPDLYISGYGCGALYRNGPGGRFADVTAAYGIEPHGWETSCGFFDADGDGRLDLYVARYVEFGPHSRQFCYDLAGVPTACGPLWYPPQKGSLYQNRGNRFVDITARSGFDAQSGKGLGVAFAPLSPGSGVVAALANDQMPGDLFERKQDPVFEDVALQAGTAFDMRGQVQSGMGVDWGDSNNDGSLNLVVTTFRGEPTSLYTQVRPGQFEDRGTISGLGETTSPYVGFGVRFFDYDNDGWLDLVMANGHVHAGMDLIDPSQAYAEPLLLFHNRAGRFELEPAARAGLDFTRRIVGRGLAVGDYDNDGGLDILVIDSEGSALLLHNEAPGRQHWIELDLEGTDAPRNGEGALVQLNAGKLRLTRAATTSGSYLSANPSRLHFGLGSARLASNIVIDWPRGGRQSIVSLEADRIWRIRQGQAPAKVVAAHR